MKNLTILTLIEAMFPALVTVYLYIKIIKLESRIEKLEGKKYGDPENVKKDLETLIEIGSRQGGNLFARCNNGENLKPTAKVIQIVHCDGGWKYLCLCADGTIWIFMMDSQVWTLLCDFNNKGYV